VVDWSNNVHLMNLIVLAKPHTLFHHSSMSQGITFTFPIQVVWKDQTLPEHFDRLLSFAGLAFDALRGTRPDDPRMIDCGELILKILMETSTIRRLYEEPTTVTAGSNRVLFYDFSSARVLARTVLETFVVFHEVFIVPQSEDDREFEYCRWRLRGFRQHQNYTPVSREGNAQLDFALQERDALRQRLKLTRRFLELDEGGRKGTLKSGGKFKIEGALERAGFSTGTFYRIYGLDSTFVHAEGSVVKHLRAAKTLEEQRKCFGLTFNLLQTVISRLIKVLSENFEPVRAMCAQNHIETALAYVYSDAARLIDDPQTRQWALKTIEKD